MFIVHIFANPIHDYPMDRPVDFLTNAICNESEKRANRGAISVCVFDKKNVYNLHYKYPMQLCILQK